MAITNATANPGSEIARNAPVNDFDWLALADPREARVTEFFGPVQRIGSNPVCPLANSRSGLAKGKAPTNTDKQAI